MKRLSSKQAIKCISSLVFFLIATLLAFSQAEAKPIKKNIPSLNAKVTKLRFYEADSDSLPYKQRDYRTEFQKSSTRFMWWELTLEYPTKSPKTYFNVSAIYYKSDGGILKQWTARDFYIDPALTSVAYTYGWGWSEPGNWPVGTYRADFFIKDQKVASGSFSITDTQTKTTKQDKKSKEKEVDFFDEPWELP